MTRKPGYAAVILLAFMVLGITSCDEFFSGSWGNSREYDPEKITIDAGNVDSWLDLSVGNPALASAIAKKIQKELAGMEQGNPNSNQIKLQKAGTKIAVEASGVGTVLIKTAGELTKLQNSNGTDAEDEMKKILSILQKDFNKDAATDIGEIVKGSLQPGTNSAGSAPKFSDAYVNSLSPSDVGQVVMVLALSVFDDILSTDFKDLGSNENKKYNLSVQNDGTMKIAENTSPTPEQVALAAYYNLIVGGGAKYGDDPITGPIKGLFTQS